MTTLAEHIIAKASGQSDLKIGDVVNCQVDLAMVHDSSGPRRVKPILERLGVNVWDNQKIVVATDHFVPADSDETKAIQTLTRQWVQDQDINAFYDQQGICHVVLPEKGHLEPGMFCVGGDSHSPTGGAFGAYMFGIGASEMAGVMATGEIWLRVPETILISWTGKLPEWVLAKDMMLATCGRIGMGGGRYQAIQYAGDTIQNLSMQERMTMSNMAAELGAQTGLIMPDEKTIAYITATGKTVRPDWRDYQIETASHPNNIYQFDAKSLAPQIAAPHSPANSADADSHDKTKVDMAYIGACTGAKYDDLAAAAKILKGRKVASSVTFKVAPASALDQKRATADGIMTILENAGAEISPNACGMCAGYGADRLGPDQTCISSTARNFKGRMGDPTSCVYLGSPYTVAASAVTGILTDPRHL
jgi:3-isopropylmalate/(R)-2-methylmalate dehydratase large subunit